MQTNDRIGPMFGGIVAGVIILFGSMMPWATLGPLSIAGTSGDGAFTAIGGLIVVALFLWWGLARRGSGPVIAGAIVSALALLVVIADGVDVSSVADEAGPTLFGSVEVGTGIYITGLGAVGGIISGVIGFRVPDANPPGSSPD